MTRRYFFKKGDALKRDELIDITYIKEPKEITGYLMVFHNNLVNIRSNKKRINFSSVELAIIGKMDVRNILVPDKKTLDAIATEFQVPRGTIGSSLGNLIKEETIIKIGSNTYMVNPYLFNKTRLKTCAIHREQWDRIALAKFKDDVRKEMTKKDGIRIMNQVDNILNGDNNDQR
jgi:hypothetical protein